MSTVARCMAARTARVPCRQPARPGSPHGSHPVRNSQYAPREGPLPQTAPLHQSVRSSQSVTAAACAADGRSAAIDVVVLISVISSLALHADIKAVSKTTQSEAIATAAGLSRGIGRASASNLAVAACRMRSAQQAQQNSHSGAPENRSASRCLGHVPLRSGGVRVAAVCSLHRDLERAEAILDRHEPSTRSVLPHSARGAMH
ncbi:hypothetical protein VTO73DRAFT_5115 [Trametes versicolor]